MQKSLFDVDPPSRFAGKLAALEVVNFKKLWLED